MRISNSYFIRFTNLTFSKLKISTTNKKLLYSLASLTVAVQDQKNICNGSCSSDKTIKKIFKAKKSI